MLFTVWWISAIIMFLVAVYGYTYSLYNEGAIARWYRQWDRKDGWSEYADKFRGEKRFFSGVGFCLILCAIGAGGIFSIPLVLVISMARRRALRDREKRNAAAAALKTLAAYETDPQAKAALERGDASAYVDRYLNLDRCYK